MAVVYYMFCSIILTLSNKVFLSLSPLPLFLSLSSPPFLSLSSPPFPSSPSPLSPPPLQHLFNPRFDFHEPLLLAVCQLCCTLVLLFLFNSLGWLTLPSFSKHDGYGRGGERRGGEGRGGEGRGREEREGRKRGQIMVINSQKIST